jgi:uncharacterized membrane protein
MAKIQKSIQISAPVEKVFDYLLDPDNLPAIWPSLVEVKDIQRTPGEELSSYKWTYKMAGMRFEGTTETTESMCGDSNGIVTRETPLQDWIGSSSRGCLFYVSRIKI